VFEAIFVPADYREAVSDRAWIQAMLDAERALAAAEAGAGVIPVEAADAIAAACEWQRFDPAELAEQGRAPGNPVEPLVRALTEAVEGDAGRYVHWGATSQDILDTAAMLISRTALDLLLDGVAQVAAECAALAESHRATPMAARTLLQQAVPTTFGLKAAGWLVAVLEARRGLLRARDELAAQLGGAAGTLAPLGDAGAGVSRLFAEELGLKEPVVPWHTNRVRIAGLGAALAITAGVLAKIGLDVALLAQTEVGEVAEAEGGVSSTMPQKRNPVGSALAIACARLVEGHASVLFAALPQEHERAVGGWHSEWPALSGALAFTGGAAEAVRRALDGLEVDADRMRANLDAAGGAVMAEQASFVLADQIGRREAHERVAQALARGEALAEDLDPASYLGSAETFVDAALAFYRSELG
jgi:3-carboxy-cis,cis-muconate cycloisomerase